MINQIKSQVPKKPGCYLYYSNSTIIYIGKAKNLQKRMLSYFERINNIKTTKMVSEITEFKFIVTQNEKESLILENNLIKKHQPKYNILLKDDKRYPYILLTDEDHPRLLKVRNTKQKGTYFGPFPSGSFASQIIEVIGKEVPFRKCMVMPKEECIYYHLKQCYAPCIKEVDQLEVNSYKDQVKKLFTNKMKRLEKLITKKMHESADLLEFEDAQRYQQLLADFSWHKENQVFELTNIVTMDIIAYYQDDDWISIGIISVIDGKVNNLSTVMISYVDDINQQIIASLYNHYLTNLQPELFLVNSQDIELAKLIEDNFLMKSQKDWKVDYQGLLAIAQENANLYFKNNVDKVTNKLLSKKEDGYKELQAIASSQLKLIEVYDISHFSGDSQIGVKVAYQNGSKSKKLYRKYKIKEANKADDYASMKEVLERRLNPQKAHVIDLPDLIILDGGKGQVQIGKEVLEKYQLIGKIKLIGLVKNNKHQTEAIVNLDKKLKQIDKQSGLYKFLFQMQEEVHRFAIDFHHKLETKSLFISELDGIQGLGLKRKKILLEEYQTVKSLKKAKVEDLIKLKIPSKVAKVLIDKLNQGE